MDGDRMLSRAEFLEVMERDPDLCLGERMGGWDHDDGTISKKVHKNDPFFEWV